MVEEYISKNYTLEKHLKSLSEKDKEYELLYSIWDLNKRNLSNGLNVIPASFPNYSMHDVSHSMTIINNIQCFLGEERIKKLGATDTFLLLMAGLTHDIGMILTYKMLEKEWDNKDIIKSLDYYSRSDDHVISEAAKLILQYKNGNMIEDGFKWALEIKNAVVLLTAEIFRGKHAEKSADYLTNNAEFKKLAENFYSDQLPRRFVDLLANVAFLHGESFEEVMSRLYQKANGFKGDFIHPRFIACMIRLGDLLDFDSNRFNAYFNETIKEMPETSVLHQQKHASVKHMLVSPTSIEAELDCPNEKVYRVARSWFDWLEEEVEKQSREWTNIAPDDLGGFPPVISRNSIRILYNGIQASSELLNLRFAMSQQKMFNILQGGGIYKEPGFAFIREIVQNAFDASKIQMWNDIKAGFYDSYFEKEKEIDQIGFPNDIMPTIYKQYPVSLTVKWKDSDRKILHFECKDHGTGISEATLLRMTQYVGESYKKDSKFEKLYHSMPYWLRPTAAFGIGLQSVFFVTQAFEVETSYSGETTKRIIFRSAADGQYSSIAEENIDHKRGTTVKVDIAKERFAELFGTSFAWEILDSVDVFKGEGDNIYLAKIDKFVRDTFKGVSDFTFRYESENPERSFVRESDDKETEEKENGDYKFTSCHDDGFLVFRFYEKKYGSTFVLWFNNQYELDRLPKSLMLRDVRVANAHFNYWKTMYMGFSWNLNNQTTDKIVDLSRDNLTHNGRQWISKTLLEDLLPDFLKMISDTFKKEIKYKNNNLVNLDIQYVSYCLTSMAFQVNPYDLSLLNKIVIPKGIASYNKKAIKAKRLQSSQIVYLVKGFKTNGHNTINPEEQNKIEKEYEKILSDKTIIWGRDFLHSVLMFNYRCTEIVKFDYSCKIYKLEKYNDISMIPTLVKCSDSLSYILALENSSYHECSRNSIYAIEQYPHIAVNINYISGFERFPDYSSCCIYSPFSNKEQIKDLLDMTAGLTEDKVRELIRSKLSEYITPYMMKIIKEDNLNKCVTEDEIREEYITMIYDFVKAKRNVE